MLLKLDFSSEVPIYMQIRNGVVMGIAAKKLLPGERLPTIRGLADEIGVNMMTVNKAYGLLKQEGVISADRRSGAVVVAGSDQAGLPEKAVAALQLLVSEAKLRGLHKEEFISLISRLFDETEGLR